MPSWKAYLSDLTDAEWEIVEPVIPAISPEAVIVVHERREIVNGILYVDVDFMLTLILPLFRMSYSH